MQLAVLLICLTETFKSDKTGEQLTGGELDLNE